MSQVRFQSFALAMIITTAAFSVLLSPAGAQEQDSEQAPPDLSAPRINPDDLSEEQKRLLRIREAQRMLEQNKGGQEEAQQRDDDTAVADDQTPVVELDLEALLKMNYDNRRGVKLEDPVWEFDLPPGRKLLLVPLAPLAVEQPTQVKINKSFRLTGARQLAWYVPDDEDAQRRSSRGGRGQLQMDPPLLTIDLTLTPKDTIMYTLPRKLQYAEVTDGDQAYAVVVDQRVLDRPKRPNFQRLSSRQRAEAMLEFREQMDNYNRKISFARQLPTEFAKPTPSVIYGVYSVPTLMRGVTFDGAAPLPWEISLDLLKRLQELTGGRGNHFEVNLALDELFKDDEKPHLYDTRAAAIVIANGALRDLPENSPLVDKIQMLLSHDDRRTRMRIVSALASGQATGAVASAMLAKAMQDPDPEVGLIAMQARAGESSRRGPVDQQQIDAMASGAQRLLVSAMDQPVEQVLAVPLGAASNQPEAVASFVKQIDLSKAPATRRDPMVKVVVQHAAEGDPLALGWLSHQLLGGGDVDLQKRTLKQLIAYDAAEPETDERGRTARKDPLKLPLNTADHGLFACMASNDDQVRGDAWTALQYFSIDTRSRRGNETASDEPGAIFDALTQAALSIEPTPVQAVEFMAEHARDDAAKTAFKRLVFEGKGPARFAAMQQMLPKSGKAIATWLGDLSLDQRVLVARVWYERYDTQQVQQVTSRRVQAPQPAEEQNTGGGFLGALKKAVTGGGKQQDQQPNAPAEGDTPADPSQADALTPDMRAPLTIGLLRQSAAQAGQVPPIIEWFGAQMAEDKRPNARQWAQAIGSEEPLLMGMASPDEIFGLGCAEAMLSLISKPQPGTAQQLRQAAIQHAGSINDPVQKRQQLSDIWKTVRQQVTDQLLQQVPGEYKLTMKIHEPGRPQPGERGYTTYKLGEVLINLDENELKIGPDPLAAEVAQSPFAIRLTDLSQLLERAEESGSSPRVRLTQQMFVNLEPDPAGNYTGRVNESENVEIELIRQN